MQDARHDLVGVQRSPASRPYPDFRKGWGRCKHRSSSAKDPINTEIFAPGFTSHSQGLANERGLFTRCIDKQLTLNTQRGINIERGNVSGSLITLDGDSLRLAYLDTEPRCHRLE